MKLGRVPKSTNPPIGAVKGDAPSRKNGQVARNPESAKVSKLKRRGYTHGYTCELAKSETKHSWVPAPDHLLDTRSLARSLAGKMAVVERIAES